MYIIQFENLYIVVLQEARARPTTSCVISKFQWNMYTPENRKRANNGTSMETWLDIRRGTAD